MHILANKSIAQHYEVKTLFLAALSCLLLAIAGISIAIYTDSSTMLLDGLYAAIDFFVTVGAMIIAIHIHEPPNAKYHYGYAKYEPLIAAIEGILIIAVAIVIMITSVQNWVHHEQLTNYTYPVIYTVGSTLISLLLTTRMRNLAKQFNSVILKAGSVIWLFDAVISFGAFLGFLLAYLLSTTAWAWLAHAIDPLMSILLALTLIYNPIKIVRGNLRDLLDVNPNGLFQHHLTGLVQTFCSQHPVLSLTQIKLRKAGRKLFATVYLKAQENLLLTDCADLKQELQNLLLAEFTQIQIEVLFSPAQELY